MYQLNSNQCIQHVDKTNYIMKFFNRFSTKLVKEGIKFLHNRRYYDENWFMKGNPTLKDESHTFFRGVGKVKFEEYFKEAMNRQDQRAEELPEVIGEYSYFGRYAQFDSGNDYQIIVRTNSANQEEIILDLRKLQWLKPYQKTLTLTKTVLSDDNSLIAFGCDLRNDEHTVWMIKGTKEDSPQMYRERLKQCANAKFTEDNKYLIYTQYDDMMRPSVIKLHKLGTSQEQDTIIYQEPDEKYYTEIQVTKDQQFFVILCTSKLMNKIMVFNRKSLTLPPKLVTLISEADKCLAYCQHANDTFYVLTNTNAFDFKVQTLKDSQLNSLAYKDFYTPETGEVIQELDLFHKHLVLYLKKDGDSYLRVIKLDDGQTSTVKVPLKLVYEQPSDTLISKLYSSFIMGKSQKSNKSEDPLLAATISPGLNHNFYWNRLRFHLDSPLVYNQVYELDLETQILNKLQDCKLTGKPLRRNDFVCQKLMVPSRDGTLVPMTVVHHRDVKLNRQNRVLMFNYGAYGLPQEVPFNVVHLSALERKWVLAFTHVRGGNEKGHAWHQAATKMMKLRSVEDLLACAQMLVTEGYTHPSLLCGVTASAGATNLGAAINMRPDLFKAVILNVPFLDLIGSLTDESLPLTVSDYDEFGNPLKDEAAYEYIKAYSPYDNLQDQVYPAVYIIAGKNDHRAPLWGVQKYITRFRRLAKSSQRVNDVLDKGLLVELLEGGHHGNAGVSIQINFQFQSHIEQWSKCMAFLEYFTGEGNREITIQSLTRELDESVVLVEDVK